MVDRGLGFSLWLDFIERDYLKNEFLLLIEKGIINGATSNPAIFAQAITTSPAYKEQLESLSHKNAKEKYEALAIEDIKTAAKALRKCYDENNDGYISIEVDPFISDDTEATVLEGVRLFKAISEPNVMVKVPATEAGYEAMSRLMAQGISVNATLIFSPEQAEKCLSAMEKGTELYSGRVDGVISVFVSRFDGLLDEKLISNSVEPSKIGIFNAAKIYNIIEESEFKNIRTLFASTGIKNNSLDTDYYIKELLAPHSINTAPLKTIKAYIKEPSQVAKMPISSDKIDAYFDIVEKVGIDMSFVYESLLSDGLISFEKAFKDMLESIE